MTLRKMMPIVFSMVAVLMLAAPAAEAQIFVKAAAVGANNGLDWANAYTDLQSALGVAVSGDQIWVAAGTYKPDRGTGDRSAKFTMVDGVAIY
ncbi:MAG: hypothetical protein KKI02_06250, partial [Planctomycetes bacterium]|nr:hypothetical protein [Planctomycetota bacterium]